MKARQPEPVIDNDFLGVGLYTASEAAALLQLSPQRIHRWLAGWYASGGAPASPPLWRPQLPTLEGKLGLGFLDLVQARVVRSLVEQGVGMRALRLALARAAEIVGRDHPFASHRFRTDGRNIFLEIARSDEEPELLDLVRRQYAIHRVIAPSLKDLDYSAGMANRWWPLGHDRLVVVDPARSFGQPITARSGIPTETLAAAVAAEGSVRAVTRWYPVSEREVRDAVRFEQRQAA